MLLMQTMGLAVNYATNYMPWNLLGSSFGLSHRQSHSAKAGYRSALALVATCAAVLWAARKACSWAEAQKTIKSPVFSLNIN